MYIKYTILKQRSLLIMAKEPKLKAENGDKPSKKSEISKQYMKEYIKYQANTPENIAWFIELCKKNNTVKKKSKDKGEYYDIDVSAVRDKFVEKFIDDFPALKKESETTYVDSLDDFFNK